MWERLLSMLKRKIKIGYEDLFIKHIQFKDETLGEYDSTEQKIYIQKNLKTREEGNTFLHEVLHAGMEISGLSADGGPLKNQKQEELTVNALTNLLTQVIRDNTWFLPYLFGAINGSINGKRSRSKALATTQKRFKKLTLSTNRKQNRSGRSRR
tara:strand:- start:212 stop:673 length:462 start_codon:yes stop_codon:yes gene_type:complete